MKHLKIMNDVTRAFHKVGFKIQKHSPELLVAAGIIGGVASCVLACKATLKVNEVTDKAKTNLDRIHTAVKAGHTEAGETYSKEDSKKDLAIVYAHTAVDFAKLYGPALGLGTLSIVSILSGHKILRTRNVALAAAYATVDQTFKDYRKRVVDRFGQELDRELRYNIKAKEVEEIVVDEKGEQKPVKKTVHVADNPNDYSDYARFFDETCVGWEKNAEYNLMFVKQIQNHANDILKARGHLLLNDVYDMLGIPRTQAGMVVGWVYDEKNPVGDNYVDFGLFDVSKETVRNFVNGYERSILLDFNVDGNIYDLMK